MKHISLRVDDKDYEFIRNLSKKKRVRESNIFREVFHDFVLRSTGQASFGELESAVRKNANELRDLETRIARIEGLVLSGSLDSAYLISGRLPSNVQRRTKAESMSQEIEKNSDDIPFSEKESQSMKGSSGAFALGQTIGEMVRHFASQKDTKIEGDFLTHCVSAAENSAKIHDYQQATRYYRIALELSGEEVHSTISERIGDLQYLMGETDLALKYWNDALSFFLKIDSKKTNAANIYRKIGLLYVQGVYDREKGLAAFKEALKLLEDDGSKESPEIAAVYAALARLYWRTGENLDEAEKLCEKALRMAERFSLLEVEAEAHQTLGFLRPISKKDEIMEHFQNSLRLSIENGYLETTCRAYNNLGYFYVVLGGDMRKSIQFYLEGLRFERRIRHNMFYAYTKLALSLYAYLPMGEWAKAKESVDEFLPELSTQHPHRFASAFQIVGLVALYKGEYGNAEESLNVYLPLAIKAKEVQAIIPSYISLGLLYFEKLEYTRAEEYARRALELCRSIGSRFDNCMRYSNCLTLLSEICEKLGKLSEAAALVSELSSLAKSIDEDWAHGYSFRALGALQANEGKYKEALDSFSKSIQKWRRLEWPFELAQDIYELGLAYLMIGEKEKALQQITTSLEIFTTLGAKAYIERAAAKKEALMSTFLDSSTSPSRG